MLKDRVATRSKVMSTLAEIVEKAVPGDRIVFTLSSQGTQVRSQPGSDEADGCSSATT